jgi:D-alanyl-D-alanine carboxypeptidase
MPEQKTPKRQSSLRAVRYSDTYSYKPGVPSDPLKRAVSSHPRHTNKIWLKVLLIIILAGLLAVCGQYAHKKLTDNKTAAQTTTHTAASDQNITSDTQATKPTSRYDIDSASSLTVVVNKQRPLAPKNYVPAQLVVPDVSLRLDSSAAEMHVRPETAAALEKMFTAAKLENVQLRLSSGYRSYDEQVQLYNYYVSIQGQSVADAQSARPGHSEHQTGLAADVAPVNGDCDVVVCFGDLPEGKWLAANAYKYGFIIRYPEGKMSVTGYEYEPWHIRYVGTSLAKSMHDSNITTLEEYFHLPAAPDYQ